MSARKKLVLVDGSSYLYRAFHAMPNLTNSSGQATGAVYGVTNMLRKLINDEAPQYMAVVFDAKGKTFRDDLYKEYKANRPSMPSEMRTQVDYVYAVVKAMGLPLLVIPRVEADDVIGTLSTAASKQGFETLISTGDKDMAQLVDDNVTIVDTMQGVFFDHDGVVAKFGVPPDRIIDYLALIGDTSDNVPGVPKVGPKTAVKWLAEHGSLQSVMDNADKIGGKVGENLRAALPNIPLSAQLVTIKRDVELDEAPKDLEILPADEDSLRDLFVELEFKTWLTELGGVTSQAKTGDVDIDYTTITTQKDLDSWIKAIKKAGSVTFDTETTSLNAIDAELVGVSFSIEPGKAAYIPVAHSYDGAPRQLDRDSVLAKLKPMLEDEKIGKIGQNLKYDKSVLANYDITLVGITHDTMLESYVLDSAGSRHDMDTLAMKHLGHKTVKFEEVAGKGKDQLTFDQVEVEAASHYAAEDADITCRLHQALWPALQQTDGLRDLYTDLEVPLLSVLSRVERNGVCIDSKMLQKQSKELTERAAEIEIQAHELAGTTFNISSPKQIQEVLYEKLSLPVLKKTPKGQPSTAEPVLQELAADYELPSLILEFRSVTKLKSTYTDKLPDLVSAKTKRIHTSYHQAVAATGRLSSSDPNLQNIPIRTAEGRRIREAFVPEKGNKLIAADYSQIELRIMAHLSQDEGLLKAFAEGLDVHRATAAEVFDVEPDAVSDDQRRHAKAINFGLIYGMSAFGLSQQLKIERADAQEYVDLYFARYPGVKAYMERTREHAREAGYVETVFGRRLYLPDINASNFQRRQYAERTAINAPMQGTAADLIKKAMLAVDAYIQEQAPEVRMIMQVHDELVFELPKNAKASVKKDIEDLMCGVAELSVPLEVDSGEGASWAQAHS